MTTPGSPTNGQAAQDDPATRRGPAPGAADDGSAARRATGRRRARPAVVPLVHPPRVPQPVRRIPPRWDDTVPGDARTTDATRPAVHDEEGSLVTEYGLVAVLGATIVGLAVRWASDGAITELLGALLARVRELVGA